MGSFAGIISDDPLDSANIVEQMLLTPGTPKNRIRKILLDREAAFATTEALEPIAKGAPAVFFDGMLFNEDELKHSISRDQSALSTESLLAHLYETSQTNFITRLNGAFAICIYNSFEKELLLIRDRVGEKPLYWSYQNGKFLFANSLKSLLASGQIPQTADLEALSYYLTFGFIPQEKSPIAKIFKLQPGHFLRFTKDKELQICPYWSYNVFLQNKQAVSEEELQFLYRDAFEKRLRRVPRSIALCNSVDEELFLTELDPSLPEKITPIIPDTNYSSLSPEQIDHGLEQIVWMLDEPLADPELPNFWQIAHHLKQQNHSALCWMTGSPPWLRTQIKKPKVPFNQAFTCAENWIKRHAILPLLSLTSRKSAYSLLRSLHTHPWHRSFLRQYTLFDKNTFSHLHSHNLHPIDPELFLHRFPALEKLGPSLSSLLYLNLKTELPSQSLLLEERLCNTFGLQRINPFLDHRIIEKIASLPEGQAALNSPLTLDKILFPETKITALQTAPSWSEKNIGNYFFEKLPAGVLVENGLVSAKWLANQIKICQKSPVHFRKLFAILILEIWFQLFIERPLK